LYAAFKLYYSEKKNIDKDIHILVLGGDEISTIERGLFLGFKFNHLSGALGQGMSWGEIRLGIPWVQL
jgi:hypothetical protein